jgi:hypothetical protein
MIVKSCKKRPPALARGKEIFPGISWSSSHPPHCGVSMSSVSTSISVRALDQELSPTTKEVGTDQKEKL